MDKETREGIENLESTVEASDLTTTPEGVRQYVDLIGDQHLNRYGTETSDAENKS